MKIALQDFIKEKKKEEIVAIDWAIKKPIISYNGTDIKTFQNIDNFKVTINSIILAEEGLPKSLFTIDKTIKLVPGATVKQKREELGWDKSDENDAKTIYQLYRENQNLFRPLRKREIKLELLRKKVKTYIRYQKVEIGINNMNMSLIREYGSFDDINQLNSMNNVCKEREKRLRKDIEKILKVHFHNETKKLSAIKGLSYILIAKLLAFAGDIGRFNKFTEFKAYSGIAPQKGKYKEKDHKYSRNLQMILIGKKQICDEFIMHRVEPYRSIYDRYKERLTKERPDESKIHIDNMARRKIADKILLDIWEILKGSCRKDD